MKTILLIGLGRFGRHIAMKLNELNHQVMAIDKDEERVNAVLPFVTNAQIGDSTSEEFLSAIGVRNFDVCIVAIGDNFQSSLETVSLLKEFGAKKWWQELRGMCRQSFCSATAPTKWYIRKSRWQFGLPSAIAPTISTTILPWATTMRSLKSASPIIGWERRSANWMCANAITSTSWQLSRAGNFP